MYPVTLSNVARYLTIFLRGPAPTLKMSAPERVCGWDCWMARTDGNEKCSVYFSNSRDIKHYNHI